MEMVTIYHLVINDTFHTFPCLADVVGKNAAHKTWSPFQYGHGCGEEFTSGHVELGMHENIQVEVTRRELDVQAWSSGGILAEDGFGRH